MFAYCNNTPVVAYDPDGQSLRTTTTAISDAHGSGSYGFGSMPNSGDYLIGGGFAAGLGLFIDDLFDSVINGVRSAYNAARDYAKTVAEEVQEKVPHVHHVVPWGSFSGRNENVRQKIKEMQEILHDANINVFSSQENLIVVSASYHSALHTDAYIYQIYSYIKPAAGNDDAVRSALYMLRLEIAAMDPEAWGY